MADVGRPSVMTEEIIRKLEEAFLDGATDLEACFFAGIGKTAFYDYQQENPEFADRKQALRDALKLQAKRNIAGELRNKNLLLSQWYLERKAKDEFSPKQEVEHSGEVTVNFNGTDFYIHATSEPTQGNAGKEPLQSDRVREEMGENNPSTPPVDSGSISE